MSSNEDSTTLDLLEIKEKTVDATGHVVFQITFDHFKSPFRVEKIFGLVDEKTNAVFKFKLVVNEDGSRKIKFKLMYVSEQPIDCKIKIDNCPSAIVEHLTIGDELKTFTSTKEDLKRGGIVDFGISVLVITTTSFTSMNNVFAERFNELSTSDFRVHCQDKQFYVHQRILREKSEYFEALLRNDCIEKRDKMLKINDFPPKIVEIFLGCFYNDALPISASLTLNDMVHVMKIADKYNAKKLFDAMDSYISQESLFVLNILCNDKTLVLLKDFLKTIEEVQTPKLTSMIYEWRRTEKGKNSLDDKQWLSLVREIPNFAMVGGNIAGRNDYQSWAQQHMSWCLSCDVTFKGRNNFAVLVGPIGEMKGAVKCSLI